jgi:hypothetical protein
MAAGSDWCEKCLLPMEMCEHGRMVPAVIARQGGSLDNPPPPWASAEATAAYWQALWDLANPDSGLGPWMEARWPGFCRGCGDPWSPGDLIRRDAFEDGYLGTCCGGEVPGAGLGDVPWLSLSPDPVRTPPDMDERAARLPRSATRPTPV